MKIPKFFYYFSLVISTIFAVAYYSLLPFFVAMAAVMFFQIPAYFLGPIMFVVYLIMKEWKEMKVAMKLLGVSAEGEDEDGED